MLRSKAELMKDEAAGKLSVKAVHTVSNVCGICLCEWDDEQAFGFMQVMDGPKTYFRATYKLRTSDDAYYIRVGKVDIPLDDFLRIHV